MNLKSLGSSNIVKVDIIDMANKPADQSKYSSYKSNEERYAAGIVPQGLDLLRRLILAEAGKKEGLVGRALVANSLFNRVGLTTGGEGIGSSEKIGARPFYDASGVSETTPFTTFYAVPKKWVSVSGKKKRVPTNRYKLLGKFYDGKAIAPNANSIDSFILATNQYQPVQDGRIWKVGRGKDNELTAEQIADADAAIALAKDTGELERKIIEEENPTLREDIRFTPESVQSLIQATGFRTPTARKDASQIGPGKGNEAWRNHVFTTAGNDHFTPTKSVDGVGDVDRVEEVLPKPKPDLSIPRPKPERFSEAPKVSTGREYIVQAGDTAGEIAKELGIRVEDLGGLGDDPDLIHPGQVLTAPPKSRVPQSKDEYRERLGDAVARRQENKVEAQRRHGDFYDRIEQAGGELYDKAGQTGDILMNALGLGDPVPDREHIVQAGDTAGEIAKALGVRVEDLGGLGEDRDLIHPGQVLTAPPEKRKEESTLEELRRVWGLYRGGSVNHSNINDRIYNIMKPRD